MVLVAPMIAGVSNFSALRREFPAVALLAHPALAGNQIAPAALLGTLFRVFGADAVIFPNHGGRFSYTRATCEAIVDNLRSTRDRASGRRCRCRPAACRSSACRS